jgi:DNA-binding Lrp family transcriptional regulator
MRIDQTDLALIRAIEWGGILAHNSAVRRLGLSDTEVRQRLARLREEALLKAFRATIFVPKFLGDKWVWGCTLIQTRRPGEVADAIRHKTPFVTELVFNDSLPSGLGHNLSATFYGTDFAQIQKFLSELSDLSYVEVYQIGRYEFPLPQPFSTEELRLMRAVAAQPDADLSALSRSVNQTRDWVETKLESLVWDPENSQGVILVLPEIDWRVCENFLHVHFLLEISVSPESVSAELSRLGFAPVLGGRLFHGRYLQMEADVWGFDDLRRRKSSLDSIRGVTLSGILLAQENRIVSDWVPGLLSQS